MPDHPSGLSGAFHLPFAEQIAFFRQKLGNLVPTQSWDDMLGAAHDRGFMVAGAMEADLLADLAAAVDKSIAEGRGIEEFRRDFKSIVRKHGWTGWTGEGSVKGEAWRAKVIYQTNGYTSYAAGRFAQLKAGNFPFWVYRHGGSLEPRLVHLGWNGLALPPDHPFWLTYYPPSDWGCSCYVVGARSAAGIKRLGGDPDKKLPASWRQADPKTGRPHGVGKGWDYAPGASVVDTVNAMARKVGSWEHGTARTFLQGLPVPTQDAISSNYRDLPSTREDARRLATPIFEDDVTPVVKSIKSLGMVPEDQRSEIERLIGKPLKRSDFRITADMVRHVRAEHSDPLIEASRKQRPVKPADFARLIEVLSYPDEIVGADSTGQGETAVAYRKRIGSEIYTAIVVVNRRFDNLTVKTFYVGI